MPLFYILCCSCYCFLLMLALDYSLYSILAYYTVFNFFLMFLRSVIFFFSLYFWSSNYFLGIRLLFTICWATLLLNLLPNPLSDFENSYDVAFATFLYYSYFFFFTSPFSIYLIFNSIIFNALSILIPFSKLLLIYYALNFLPHIFLIL